MKKIILAVSIPLIAGTATNAQNINSLSGNRTPATDPVSISRVIMPPPEDSIKNKAYYLNKSRNNKIASFSLLIGGALITGIGALTFPKNYDPIWGNDKSTGNQADASTTVIVVGIAAMLSSIPFTILSAANKRKAKLMVASQKTGFGVPATVSRNISGITLSFPLGK